MTKQLVFVLCFLSEFVNIFREPTQSQMTERNEDGRNDDDDHSKSQIVVEVKERIESRLA